MPAPPSYLGTPISPRLLPFSNRVGPEEAPENTGPNRIVILVGVFLIFLPLDRQGRTGRMPICICKSTSYAFHNYVPGISSKTCTLARGNLPLASVQMSLARADPVANGSPMPRLKARRHASILKQVTRRSGGGLQIPTPLNRDKVVPGAVQDDHRASNLGGGSENFFFSIKKFS